MCGLVPPAAKRVAAFVWRGAQNQLAIFFLYLLVALGWQMASAALVASAIRLTTKNADGLCVVGMGACGRQTAGWS